jgi:hypothetical protein
MLTAVLQTHAIADHNVFIVLACHKHQNDQTLRGIRSMIRNESERNGEKKRKVFSGWLHDRWWSKFHTNFTVSNEFGFAQGALNK